MHMELRIGMISDVHYGSDSEFQKGSKAPELLSSFVSAMHEFRPHLVVDLGDRVNNLDPPSDPLHLRALVKTTGSLPCPLRYVLGNHDLVHLSVRETEELLGQQLTGLRAERLHGFPLLFVNSEGPRPTGSDYDRLWPELDSDSGGNEGLRPIITFSHRPLLKVPLDNHKLFEPGSIQHCPWGVELLGRLSAHGFRPVCINGHLHWNHL
ncbi:MAG TPA: hypothetical protein DDW87_01235, partial [Firmicutes bacterium]|nr:hypothetical protein [Bacillota bacterium]